jgi:cyclic pyranopterin phosphate synthase
MRCAAPFNQLLLKPDGTATPCCYLYGHKLGPINKLGWEAVWNGEKLRKLRREFLQGNPRTCRGRMQSIGCHQEFRSFENTTDWTEQQLCPPRRLDVRLNGQCNLSCRMCEVWQEPNGVYDANRFWQEGARQLFPYLQEIDVLGGEPFIQRDTFKLIDTIATINPTCTWGFITNGHFPWSKRLSSYLGKVALRYIQLSLDAVCPHTYTRQRGGQLALPQQTLQHLLSLRSERDFKLKLSICVTTLNWWEVPAFLQLCTILETEPVLQFTYYAPDPSLSCTRLPLSKQKAIKDYWLAETDARWHASLHPLMAPLTQALEAKANI